MVIDGAVTLMGSYNWTEGAARNSEDLNLVSSPAVAAAYAAHGVSALLSPFGSIAATTGVGVDQPPRPPLLGSARSHRLRRHACKVLRCRKSPAEGFRPSG
jgi:hypothetical protein